MALQQPMKTNPSWIETITSADLQTRDRSVDRLAAGRSLTELLQAAEQLDAFWRKEPNLYHRVRALFFLASIFRYHVPRQVDLKVDGRTSARAVGHLLGRRFVEAIDVFRAELLSTGPNLAVSSGLARAYYQLGIQTLADQVRKSVRTVRGNQWMFRVGHPGEHPLRIHPMLLGSSEEPSDFPLLVEKTSVRMDFSHSAWSDIFFLGMDYPEGARVINASIDLAVRGRDPVPRPPIEAYLRIIDRPLLRLVSVDLGAEAEIDEIDEVFDFARDYLGLLKAALIASGVVPPAMEGCHQKTRTLLRSLIGQRGRGLELVSQVNDIPKGSRLAVSTNLLGCLISILMRATGQISKIEGGLEEQDRRLVAARAILGEWLGGSGGGWQDSGGIWPGIKLIQGCPAMEGDPEHQVSRGRLLPQHQLLDDQAIAPETRQRLQESLILVHGGMAQNVGPILEMVTEKYLVRSDIEWAARQEAVGILDKILAALRAGDLKQVGALTTLNFQRPLHSIIPAVTNQFTDTLIELAQQKFQSRFWGFWMLGGMSGGGMGFIFDPKSKLEAQAWLAETMIATKRRLQDRLPFAMDPVVYDFSINDRGSWATLLRGDDARMPDGYYGLIAPKWIKQDFRNLSEQAQRELIRLSQNCRESPGSVQWLLDRILPSSSLGQQEPSDLTALLRDNGFDSEQHEQIRSDLKLGRIGLAQNRLPAQTTIDDVLPDDVIDVRGESDQALRQLGAAVIADGALAVVTLAAGAGSRWTGGAGVVKGLHPFWKLLGKHRSFIDIHLAKTKKTSTEFRVPIPHVITTGYLTHGPIEKFLSERGDGDELGPVYLSRGMSVGLRTIPTARDLRFYWEETHQQVLDEQQQKVRESARNALMQWAIQQGEASDYLHNTPLQCLHPVGHWYEVPNMLRNGLLRRLLSEYPKLRYLLLHNVDTLGASIDPLLLGHHIREKACLTFEVIPRRIDDRGGGLARVDGHPRLVEGLALPREEDEFRLRYYNSLTTWIDLELLLSVFGLSHNELDDQTKVDSAVRRVAQRMPTYLTIKDVKKRWGHGQEDIFPVTQFEKLWGDMTILPDVRCRYLVVDVFRGQQLKDPAQLDGWFRDGSSKYVENLCEFTRP